MKPSPQSLLWLVVACLPAASLAAQTGAQDSTPPFPCADTSLTQWLAADTAASGNKVDARALKEHFLARTYAPILRFAPSERYFPTIPFWTAFLDTAGALTPLPSRQQRARLGDEKSRLPLVSAVREAYDDALNLSARPYELKLPLPVVFYRVCDLMEVDTAADALGRTRSSASRAQENERRWRKKSDHLWSYLRSDEQAWHRFGLEGARTSDTTLTEADTSYGVTQLPAVTRSDSLIRFIRHFHVIQYFVYYLQDWGLMGHSEDIEYAFVFVPADSTAAKSFRVVVGAGHDPPAPNNVLVMAARDASKRRYYHPNILVELGGHSSAPDMPPFGQFSAGLDVNWHIDDLWGTRDEQAMAGLSFSGRYEGTMTFPRDPEDAVTLFPKGFGTGSDSGRGVLADLVRVSPDYLAARAHEASHRKDPPSTERRELAERILAAYRTTLGDFEARRRSAIEKSASVDSVRSKYGAGDDKVQVQQAPPMPESEVDEAVAKDARARAADLDTIDSRRSGRIRNAIDSLLRLAKCPDTDLVPAGPPAGCPQWLPDTVRDSMAQRVVDLLETRSELIPADALMSQLLELLVPDPDTSGSPLDAITTEIGQVVTERLRPEYSLLPVRYLQALYQGASRDTTKTDVQMVARHLKLITRLLHPVTCDELACGLFLRKGADFESEFAKVVCRPPEGTDSVPGSVHWPRSLACTFNSSHVDSMRFWNEDVYDLRRDGFNKSRRWPAFKHKIWEHALYRQPELIFRTHLFRPTLLQVKRSRAAFERLLHAGYNLHTGRASHPYVGVIMPAFRSVAKLPGYLAFQIGPYFGWPYRERATNIGLGFLYDRQFVYFYGLFLKGHWVNNRSAVEAGSGASDFTWTLGASLWLPFLSQVHLRPGLRFDTDGIRPLLDRTVWDLQVELRR